ncbi:DUF5682 family protein [Nocardia sp. NPDC049526]|uniref:DUF5682 family protein n=1 Tax=Nocardia sp. NPDC049526 TaxID=3364316 RepID=UPI00378FB5B5
MSKTNTADRHLDDRQNAASTGPVTRVFGIRHHGPGSAKSLRTALEQFRPDAILIEGPADADPLVGYVAAEGMSPPVALLAYIPDQPAKAAFWPYAVFSPEWQALRYAAEHAVPVRFCDLPATAVLAAEDEPGDRIDPLAELAAAAGYDDAERWWDAVVESVADADAFEAITEAMGALREAAEQGLFAIGTATGTTEDVSPGDKPDGVRDISASGHSAAGGANGVGLDPDDESSPAGHNGSADDASPTDNTADEAAEIGTDSAHTEPAGDRRPTALPTSNGIPGPAAHRSASEDSPTGDSVGEAIGLEDVERQPIDIDAHTLRREAYMRQTMRKALKDGAQRLAVVCGAWHAPALAGKLGPATADTKLLKGLPKVKATVTWVPWTHSRLATTSGYGAGITSPGWYHHLFTETEQPIARWLTKVAGVLRAHDLPVSSAHIIESVRLADTLAVLRSRPLAGLSEVTEAVRSVMCAGDETMLRLVASELVVGEALGAVPDGTPTVPLDADLRARIRTLRLRQEALSRNLDLDLRKEREVERSRLLHRLRVLGIDWGTPTTGEVRSTGTFRESWTLRWRPEFAVSIIEASRWGTTIRTAAEAKILDTAGREGSTVGDLTAALEVALLADLGDATNGLITRLESAAALDHDVTHLLAALPGLTRTLRYGDVRGTDTEALAHVADGLLVRICAGLPSAVTGLDTDAAEQLRTHLDAAHTAIHTRDNDWATGEWLAALHRLADRDDVHGALVGRAVRLLADAGRIDESDSARRLSAALSIGNTAAAKAAWIDGFLGGRGLLLVHDRELLRLIDDWLRSLGDDMFVEILPLLRRTFGAFESGERRAIGQAVRDGGSGTSRTGADVTFDIERGLVAMRTVADILGVPV